MVAILFAAFSMAATVVAIFKHKADLERPISHIGIEGMMVITVRQMVFSFFDRFKKDLKLSFDVEANCNFISTTGPSGLFDHSVHHWCRFILF